jgi:hypothetical protein
MNHWFATEGSPSPFGVTWVPEEEAFDFALYSKHATPAPVLTAALFQRFSSRGEDDLPDRLLSAMRYQFGGHLERPADT